MSYQSSSHSKLFRPFISLFFVVLAIFALSGCGHIKSMYDNLKNKVTTPTKTTPQAPVVNLPARKAHIALLAPFSGKLSNLGEGFLNSAQMALFDNKAKNITITPYDTQGTSAGAIKAAQKAIAEKADIILGPLLAGNVKAITPLAQKSNIDVIAFSNNSTLARPGIYVFGHSPSQQTNTLLQYGLSHNIKRIDIIAPQDSYGQAAVGALRQSVGRFGIQLVNITYYPHGTTDFSSAARKIAQTGKVDAIVIASLQKNDVVAIAQALAQQNLNSTTIQYMGLKPWDKFASTLVGNPAVVNAIYPTTPLQAQKTFVSKYQAVYGNQPLSLYALSYDSTALAIILAQRGQAYTNSTLTTSQGFSGREGVFRLMPNGQTQRNLSIYKITSKGIVLEKKGATSFSDIVN